MSGTSATATDTGRSRGRAFAAYRRSTAARLKGSAARPYTVSVGWTTSPPERRISRGRGRGVVAFVRGADSSELARSSRGTNAASVTSTPSGRGSPETYAIVKTRNVSLAFGGTRFLTPTRATP